MRELVIKSVAIVGMLMVASFASADSSQLELYYNDCITKKIVNCKRIASAKNHSSSSMARLVEMRSAQARFYSKYREELVKEMIVHNIGTKPHKIDHFLLTRFKESNEPEEKKRM